MKKTEIEGMLDMNGDDVMNLVRVKDRAHKEEDVSGRGQDEVRDDDPQQDRGRT